MWEGVVVNAETLPSTDAGPTLSHMEVSRILLIRGEHAIPDQIPVYDPKLMFHRQVTIDTILV
jgi:hypothetical protein